ncbi:hypothetical protein FWG95_01515 [Candidatus Saccharibacteria bacterium]|nr:hypothetical protein [Candidatus Saccharibacteria bacterium]
MSENDTNKEAAVMSEVPPQQSASDTSNQDNKVSVDPSGNSYIRTTDDE